VVSRIGQFALSVEGLTLRQTAALIARCKMFVSNDSGLMHVAALSGVPTVGVFGPTDDTRTAPWGKGHLVVRKKMECCPCWTAAHVGVRQACRYGDFRCLRDLTPEEVFNRICKWVE
jgi:ADP-heptose:LPS heptosyltransferase